MVSRLDWSLNVLLKCWAHGLIELARALEASAGGRLSDLHPGAEGILKKYSVLAD